jgi:hypothetical protein
MLLGRAIMLQVLRATDALDDATHLLDLDNAASVDALIEGDIDVAVQCQFTVSAAPSHACNRRHLHPVLRPRGFVGLLSLRQFPVHWERNEINMQFRKPTVWGRYYGWQDSRRTGARRPSPAKSELVLTPMALVAMLVDIN